MKLVIVESIIGSILALLGDTFYAGFTSINLFAVVIEQTSCTSRTEKAAPRSVKVAP